MKNITALFKQLLTPEMIRFIIVGTTATIMQYILYVLMVQTLHPTIANTIAYAISFCFNYLASTKFTFRVKPTVQRGIGFAFAHLINYLLQTTLLTFFLYIGLHKIIALLPVIAICVPVNFFMVRFFLKRKTKKQQAEHTDNKP